MNQSFGPVNLSNSSLGSYSTSKASASSSGTRGEYRMAPNRKSFHESALNCCETILHLYSVFRTVLLHIDFFCLPRGRFPNNALQPAPEFVRQHVLFLIQDCQPSTELAVLPPMMLQPGNSERPRVTLPIKQKWFASAKMRYPGTPDFLGEMPVDIRAILFQFVYAMMPAYVLQI